MQIYDKIGIGYRGHRRADARIAARIQEALGDAKSILNVGAGAGSYEPPGVVAVEPSATMIRQRPVEAAPCLQAVAEALPFRDQSFDAAMGVLTVHHWRSLDAGLKELRRVVRRRIVLMTWDPEFDEQFWLTRDYLPEILALDRGRYPKISAFGGAAAVSPLLVPADCTDGFRSAFWKRPGEYLDVDVRRSISAFASLDAELVESFVARLAPDLESGEWARRNVELASSETLDIGYRIVTLEA